jgi:hypothetical protein
MRIIFLDIDGVLNYELFYRNRNISEARSYPLSEICPEAVKLLNDLCESTGAKVVISSTWRLGKKLGEMQAIFKEVGFTGEIIDFTPCLARYPGSVRGNEILAWIQANEELIGWNYYDFKEYVIFDDDSDMLYWQRDNFMWVDRHCGLTPNLIYKAKRILGVPISDKVGELVG